MRVAVRLCLYSSRCPNVVHEEAAGWEGGVCLCVVWLLPLPPPWSSQAPPPLPPPFPRCRKVSLVFVSSFFFFLSFPLLPPPPPPPIIVTGNILSNRAFLYVRAVATAHTNTSSPPHTLTHHLLTLNRVLCYCCICREMRGRQERTCL